MVQLTIILSIILITVTQKIRLTDIYKLKIHDTKTFGIYVYLDVYIYLRFRENVTFLLILKGIVHPKMKI